MPRPAWRREPRAACPPLFDARLILPAGTCIGDAARAVRIAMRRQYAPR
jgi:hypothetical protein